MISSRALEFPESPIRKLNPIARKAEKGGAKLYKVNIGQPDIATPAEFIRGMQEADLDVLSYSPSNGIEEVRESLSSYYEDCGIDINPEELIITVGGSEAELFAFFVGLEQGQKILVPEPFYTNYRGFAKTSDTALSAIPTSPSEGFHLPSRESIEELIDDRTGAILLTNPSNPTGKVYSEQELSMVRDIAVENDLLFISDEVYREFVYDGRESISILQLEGTEKLGVMIDSISKRLSVCGARIGVIASRNERFMDSALRLSQARLSPPTMGQLGLVNFLNSSQYPDEIEKMVARYEKRRDTLLTALEDIPGVEFSWPHGAFYIMVKLPVRNAEDFVRWMITDFRHDGESVMMAPGAGFYNTEGKGESQVRISYVLNREDLRQVGNLIGMGLEEYSD